ncbi:hypothetical protein [Larkinella terrae]|uniref:Uncharacterized protein n=1 Tax=Larkinella terrae TaxID=2025311 RepID=A0A7K0EKA5_9BACT|nr:hypothetical protein [Larkinella terrae]MRS61906.1 hypothetical protein [Larkinella terrae]
MAKQNQKPKTPQSEKNPELATDQALKEKAQQKLEALLKSREVSLETDEPEDADESQEETNE